LIPRRNTAEMVGMGTGKLDATGGRRHDLV